MVKQLYITNLIKGHFYLSDNVHTIKPQFCKFNYSVTQKHFEMFQLNMATTFEMVIDGN